MGENEIRHYGIKGMKWGVRRTPAQLGHIVRRTSGKAPAQTAKKAAPKKTSTSSDTPKQKKLSELTDDEIRQRISRLELERRYKDLAKEEPKKVSRGKRFCMDVLETIGKNTLTNLGTQAANHIIGDAINKIAGVDSTDAAKRVVNPQKGQTEKK